jgi:transposase
MNTDFFLHFALAIGNVFDHNCCSGHRPQTTAPKRGRSATDGARSDCTTEIGKGAPREDRAPVAAVAGGTKRTFQRAAQRRSVSAVAAELKTQIPEAAEAAKDEDRNDDPTSKPGETPKGNPRGRRPIPGHLKRERILHDLAEGEKHCKDCHEELRRIGEEVSERYEYIPAQMTVIEDVCIKYACSCTVKTAAKPAQPIEKSTAGASLLTQVIVAKYADHLPLNRQEKMFRRLGVSLPRQTPVRLDGEMRGVAWPAL